MDRLIDPRVGVVRRLTPVDIPPQFPAGFVMRRSVLCDTTRFCHWPSDASGAGYAFADETAATAAALGEAVERYCGNLIPPGLRWASHDEVRADRTDAVDPASLALFSDEQYRTAGFPFVPMRPDLPMAWAPGRDAVSGQPVLVPANLVWVSAPGACPPHTNPIIQAGLAAGRSRADAEWSALREIVERDTMALVWHGRGSLRRIEPPAGLARFAAGPSGVLHTRFHLFGNDFGLHVIGALTRDESTGYLSLGMGALPDPHESLRKALAEALQLQLFVAAYDDPDGPYMRAAAAPESPLRPWRDGRDYATAYRPDLRDVVDYGCHLQLYLDPAVQQRFEDELAEAETGSVTLDQLTRHSGPEEVRARIIAAGHRILSVDVTTDDVRACGWHAVRLVVPGLYSNSAAGLPFLGGSRLAGQLGGRPRRVLPLPH